MRAVYLSLFVVILLAPFAYLINSSQELFGIVESPLAGNGIAFLAAVFLAPLVEEVLFRAGLRCPVFSLGVTPVVTTIFLISSGQGLLISAIFFAIVILLVSAHWSLFFGVLHTQFEELHSQKFRMVFWANCLYFACAHLNNFKLSGWNVMLFWLVIAPQFVFAIVFSYLRLRNGVKCAILSHMTINLVALVAATTRASS